MHCTAAVFDFNGTLFWDTALHNRAWDMFLERHDVRMTNAEKHRTLHGKTNREILRGIFGNVFSDAEADRISEEKESIYRTLCLETEMQLAPGAEEFLGFLAERGIPHTIATASIRANVEFYFERLQLGRWFDRELVVYNDGSIRSKPDPELFEIAIRKIGATPANTLIFEDSVAGIEAAERAGAGRIIIVNSTGEDYAAFSHPVITDFAQVDRAQFSAAAQRDTMSNQ